MTVDGYERLKEELVFRKTTERAQITQAIAEARAHGDLKENAEYHAAREQQSFSEGRIKEIESKLSDAQVIDVTKMQNSGRVIFGVTVKLVNLATDEEKIYKIVGEDEANIKQNKISVSSPIARALVSKEAGDVAKVETPSGAVEYEIVTVDYV